MRLDKSVVEFILFGSSTRPMTNPEVTLEILRFFHYLIKSYNTLNVLR